MTCNYTNGRIKWIRSLHDLKQLTVYMLELFGANGQWKLPRGSAKVFHNDKIQIILYENKTGG